MASTDAVYILRVTICTVRCSS